MHPSTLSTSALDDAVRILRSGGLVAMPTETVYGLAADAENTQGVAAIFAAKGRPSFNPLITHVADAEVAQRYVRWSDAAETLARAFWPGPLTLVLPQVQGCPLAPAVTAGLTTAAIRCPAHPVARALLQAFGGGLAAPSANRSGRISPTCADHVRAEFASGNLMILEGGASTIGLESTVVDATQLQVLRILRPGSITREAIAALGLNVQYAGDNISAEAPIAPGMLLSHYAPTLPVRLNVREVLPGEALLRFGGGVVAGTPAMELNLSAAGDMEEAAQHLFAFLRLLDSSAHTAIAVMPIPEAGIGMAINDRLRRAAQPRPGSGQ